ncbi:Bacterial regulatory protein, gntR family [Flavobacterium sp. ACN2]|jgi:DNA-binding transcriptional regulator YhcF (GntR family)|uniref:GntR family transcriptional regulator n=1 Tax=unclassified Flavobacterium TaxID=196869 RepID=UPI000BB3C18D|nr:MULTISPECIES: GntR family transcriptional regulator [unclassified Flavobacterium]MDY0989475.1 GntR family transcriptional regulator [Flavobacterium sp. CFBP9031]PBI87994.1 Bacterial regulatory protein, gntR family [Flavobacterium sp. ACN2]
MKQIIQQIKNLESINSLSKHEQLVQGIINAIDEKVVTKGDLLPSVNTFISELGFARETIAKAYKELVHRGIIESKNRLGYFVATNDVKQELKVALLIFAFDIFQETFYENFRKGLGKNVQLDIFFHHNNFVTFENIVQSIKGKYGMFVIAPIPNKKTPDILKQLPTNRVLLVDRFIETDEDYNYVAQEFGDSSYNAFVQLKDKIKKYDELIFFFKPSSAEPNEILNSFKRFMKDYDIKGVIKEEYTAGSLEKGKVYFTIHNLELWEMLKDSKIKGLKIGKDIGFISHNDDIVKEIIFDGVTTFSTDFAEMGKRAADFVLNRKKTQEIIPTVLIDRNSL